MRADDKGIELRVNFDRKLPTMIETDDVRLRQVVTNLVGNAIKFTSKGNVTVSTNLIQRDTHPKLEIKISDTGIGMTPEQIEKIFNPFEQADTSVTRKFGGTGLGLSISQRLVLMMGEPQEQEALLDHPECFANQTRTISLSQLSFGRDNRHRIL